MSKGLWLFPALAFDPHPCSSTSLFKAGFSPTPRWSQLIILLYARPYTHTVVECSVLECESIPFISCLISVHPQLRPSLLCPLLIQITDLSILIYWRLQNVCWHGHFGGQVWWDITHFKYFHASNKVIISIQPLATHYFELWRRWVKVAVDLFFIYVFCRLFLLFSDSGCIIILQLH